MGLLSKLVLAIKEFFLRLFGGSQTQTITPGPVEPPGDGGRRFALLVGINKYQESGNNLSGCVADVEDVYNLLVERGFPRDNIRVLTDERATRQAILERLRWLVDDSKPGDILVYYHSGHGTQVRDRDGDELLDKMDECLVTYDHDWDNPLTDDIVGSLLDRLPPGTQTVVICDTCHSGTMTRDPNRKRRFIRAPFDIAARSLGRKLEIRNLVNRRGSSQLNHLLLSGCKDDQYSEETLLGDQVRGAMTFHLTKIIRKNPNLSWREVHLQLLSDLKRGGFTQEPQLNGPNEMVVKKPF